MLLSVLIRRTTASSADAEYVFFAERKIQRDISIFRLTGCENGDSRFVRSSSHRFEEGEVYEEGERALDSQVAPAEVDAVDF